MAVKLLAAVLAISAAVCVRAGREALTAFQRRVVEYDTIHLNGAPAQAQAQAQAPWALSADAAFPAAVSFDFAQRDGAVWVVELTQNTQLLAPDYTEERHDFDALTGRRVAVHTLRRGALAARDNCYYRGTATPLRTANGAAATAAATTYVAAELCSRRGVSA